MKSGKISAVKNSAKPDIAAVKNKGKKKLFPKGKTKKDTKSKLGAFGKKK